MIGNSQKLTVSIFGKKYSLVTDESEELVSEAALLVESLLQQMVSASTSPSEMVKRTTFVALKIAVDLLKQSSALDAAYTKAETLNDLLRDSVTSS